MTVAKYPWYFETDTAKDALEGRAMLERYLSDHCEEGSDLAAGIIVYGELVSNVVKHAPKDGVRVWLENDDGKFALCINDGGPGFEPREMRLVPDPEAESGRGLYIIAQLCDRVSYGKLEEDGFLVRAVLPVSPRREKRQTESLHR